MKRCKHKSILLSILMVFCWHLVWSQQIIKGTVTDNDHNPIIGGNIVVKGTTLGATTDIKGVYTLNVPNLSGVLVFSYIGYVTEEVPINNQTIIDMSMKPDVKSLNEIVVTGLGIRREQKSLGYAVSTVSAEQITQSGNTNFASALYGKAAGVKITTAPGGATSAVNVQIRGINSLNYNSQPLYVVDGVIIRNINQNTQDQYGVNNNGYWSDTKIRGNGILDINPADIESLTVLKGASASALYGSEAASGVIVITTKKGSKRSGLGIDVNYVFNTEKVAFTPKFQNVYGPGYDRETNLASGATEEGWIAVDTDGDGVNDAQRPYFRSYGNFGPKMDGQIVPWWDGTSRKFSAQPDNYKDFYRRGYNSNFNVALSNQNDKASYRLSYTRMDYEGISRGSKLERNTFNLNSTIKISEKVDVDLVANYINSYVHNRPEQVGRVLANYSGFFSRADDMSAYLNKYQTSEGYKYVLYSQAQRNPEEALKYNIVASDLLEYFWRNLKNSDNEYQDRLITSFTLNCNILKNLKFRGRAGGDLTSMSNEIKEYNNYPIAFNGTNSTGSYRIANGKYSIFYTDALLTYSKDIIPDLNVSINGGIQTRNEVYRDQNSNTSNGLVTENWFSLNNSFGVQQTSSSRRELLKYAFLGIVNLNYRNFLFIEGTARQENSSTLPPLHNSYFYPSVNSGFVFSEAFQMPSFLSYGKLRASYGVVGNVPPVYAANITYSQKPLLTTGGSVPSLSAQGTYGNNDIKAEKKYDAEFGLETRILQNKLGVDVTYYNARIVNQIMNIVLPNSTGAGSVLSNAGELRSHGLEAALNATPLSSGSFKWDVRFNFAINRTKIYKLMEGLDNITYYNADGGALKIMAEVGQSLGNIYVHPREKDEKGNYIIGPDGLYVMSTDYIKAGNIQPKAIGGFANTLSYKGFSLDFMIDYRMGGKMVSAPVLYAMGAGQYKSTLKYRDEAHGGVPYYIDATNQKILLPNHGSAAPDGSKVYHDGLILKGATSSGEQNTQILDAASYYLNTFTWSSGLYEEGAVFDNSYIKLREATLNYNLPKEIAQKLHFQNVRVSLIGRNLFYIWRTMKYLDPEAPLGSQWFRQGIDEGSSAATRSYGVAIHASF